MTRIIAGSARGRTLKVPKTGTRPTSDRVREAMFSTLEAWDAVAESKVLDLFAGSGALGIEAMSRGAKSVDLVEKHPPAAQIIKANCEIALGTEASARIYRTSAQTFLEQRVTNVVNSGSERAPDQGWDLVFIDPPYDFNDNALEALLVALLPSLADNAVLMIERDSRSKEPVWPAGISPLREKKYGETTLWWAEKPTLLAKGCI